MEPCIFCDIVSGTAPAHTIWESESHLAFLNIFPNRPAMTLVIPKQHSASDVFAVPDSIACSTLLAAKKVSQQIMMAYPETLRVALVFEGMGVPHLHAKLYPIFEQGESGKLDTSDGSRANDAELERIANLLRTTKHV